MLEADNVQQHLTLADRTAPCQRLVLRVFHGDDKPRKRRPDRYHFQFFPLFLQVFPCILHLQFRYLPCLLTALRYHRVQLPLRLFQIQLPLPVALLRLFVVGNGNNPLVQQKGSLPEVSLRVIERDPGPAQRAPRAGHLRAGFPVTELGKPVACLYIPDLGAPVVRLELGGIKINQGVAGGHPLSVVHVHLADVAFDRADDFYSAVRRQPAAQDEGRAELSRLYDQARQGPGIIHFNNGLLRGRAGLGDVQRSKIPGANGEEQACHQQRGGDARYLYPLLHQEQRLVAGFEVPVGFLQLDKLAFDDLGHPHFGLAQFLDLGDVGSHGNYRHPLRLSVPHRGQVRRGHGQGEEPVINAHAGDAAFNIALAHHRVENDLDEVIEAFEGHKDFPEQATDHLPGIKAEHPAQGRIGDLDNAVEVDNHHAVGQVIQQRLVDVGVAARHQGSDSGGMPQLSRVRPDR